MGDVLTEVAIRVGHISVLDLLPIESLHEPLSMRRVAATGNLPPRPMDLRQGDEEGR